MSSNDNSNDSATLWQRLRSHPAQAQAWLGLAQGYAREGLPWHLAYAAAQARRCAAVYGGGEDMQAGLGRLFCMPAAHWGPEDVLGRARGTWAGAGPLCAHLERHVQAHPADWLSWLYLARCLELDAATDKPPTRQRDVVARAIGTEVIRGETGHQLGLWRLRAGDPERALNAVQAVLSQAPERHGSWLLAAEALMHIGREAQALQAFEQAGRSQNPRLLELVADKLFAFNFVQEALGVREAVVQLDPDNAGAWEAMGQLQKMLFQSSRARVSLARALELDPGLERAQDVLREIEQAGTSREEFDRRLQAFRSGELKPDNEDLPRMMLMMSLYQNHLSAAEVAKLHMDVGEVLEAGVEAASATAREPDPAARPLEGRRLRVAYLTGDLHRQHPVNIFMLPLLRRHDRERLEVFVYHTGTFVDEYTRQARSCVDHWREVRHLPDAALHQMVRVDGIDVLVDLSGHTAKARLGVFALRAAPVQITYLGYPHSTGLRCMDWIVADEVVAPPGDEALFSEQVARVGGCVFTWSPDEEDYPLPPARLARERPLTFGCFNNLLKVTDEVMVVWGRLLAAVPDARLLLKAPVLGDAAIVRTTLGRLEAAGVDISRVVTRGPTELSLMMQEYGDVDIALDPFPYNGGTTSLQALWMGCPMVAMAGHNFVSRMGMSFLTALDRAEWIARDADEYVRIAAGLAAQIQREGWDRAAFRRQMERSPLCDVEGQTRDLESIYFEAHQAALFETA